MDRTRSIAVLDQMVLDKAIDGDIVAALRKNYNAFRHIRVLSQEPWKEAATRYSISIPSMKQKWNDTAALYQVMGGGYTEPKFSTARMQDQVPVCSVLIRAPTLRI